MLKLPKSTPAPVEPSIDVDGDMPIGDDLGDVDAELPVDGGTSSDVGSDVTEVQKLTGQLAQTMRELQEIDSDTIKYVLNSIISAFDVSALDESDRNDIVGKLSASPEGKSLGPEGGEEPTDSMELAEYTVAEFINEAILKANEKINNG